MSLWVPVIVTITGFVVASVIGLFQTMTLLRANAPIESPPEQVCAAPDYFRIRQMERDLGMPLTPFPDWPPSGDASPVALSITRKFSREDWWKNSEPIWALVYKHYPGAHGWDPRNHRPIYPEQ
jgi:hypothetical protein